MSALEAAWYSIIVLSCVFALADWRRAIYLGILIDVLRDPVRKLLPGQPVIITLSGVVVWLVIVFMVVISRQDQLRLMYRKYPQLQKAVYLLLFALVPAAGISVISYPRGWLVAAIGGASYLIPTFGVLTGFALLRKEADVTRIMVWYVIVNSVMLIGVPLEFYDMPYPALGGIDHDWIRYRTGYIVDLMCGWYRSPDIMGLHAAHVIMFSMLLAIRPQSRARAAWLLPVLWAGFCLLVSGRRKMVGIPLVFVAVFLLLGMAYRVTRVGRLSGFVAVATLTALALSLFVWSPDESAEYTDFAGSLFTEGVQRGNAIIVGSTMSTLRQSGVIGAGLGTATQGRYYAGLQSAQHAKGWQEDGISRLFQEFGVPGVILLICSIWLLLSAVMRAMRSIPPRDNAILMQLGLVSVIAGDAASFVISHQQFSGDPVNALFVTLMIGMVLRFPGTIIRVLPSAVDTVVPAPGLLAIAQESDPADTVTKTGETDLP